MQTERSLDNACFLSVQIEPSLDDASFLRLRVTDLGAVLADRFLRFWFDWVYARQVVQEAGALVNCEAASYGSEQGISK